MENPNALVHIFGRRGADGDHDHDHDHDHDNDDDDGCGIATISQRLDTANVNYLSALSVRRRSDEHVFAYDNAAMKRDEPSPAYKSRERRGPTEPQGYVEDGAYDPHDYGRNAKDATSFWETVLHIVFISTGPAMLSIPITMEGVGYASGCVLLVLLVCFYAYILHMVVGSEYEICKRRLVPNMTYSEAVFEAVGNGPRRGQWLAPYAKHLSYVVFMCVWFGGCCYGLVLIAQIMQTSYSNLFGVDVDLRLMLKILFVPVTLLCTIRNLNYLVPFSVLGCVLNNVVFVGVLYYVFADPTPWRFGAQFGSLQNVPLFVGCVLFNINVTGLVLPLKNNMRHPRSFNSPLGVLCVSYAFISTWYSFFAVLCCLKYGGDLQTSVIANLPKDRVFTQVLLMLTVVTMVLQSPLIYYVTIDVIWNNIFLETKKSTAHPVAWESALRVAVVALSFAISYTAPSITLFLSFSGTVGTSIDSIFFPALVQTLVAWKINKNKSTFRRVLYKNALIIVFALIMATAGIIDCFREFF